MGYEDFFFADNHCQEPLLNILLIVFTHDYLMFGYSFPSYFHSLFSTVFIVLGIPFLTIEFLLLDQSVHHHILLKSFRVFSSLLSLFFYHTRVHPGALLLLWSLVSHLDAGLFASTPSSNRFSRHLSNPLSL